MWSSDRTINVATVAAFLFFILWLPLEIWEPQWFPIQPLTLLAIAAGGAVIVLTRAWLWQVGLVGGPPEAEPFILQRQGDERLNYRLPDFGANDVEVVAPSDEATVAENIRWNQTKHATPASLLDVYRREGGVVWLNRRLWAQVDRRTVN